MRTFLIALGLLTTLATFGGCMSAYRRSVGADQDQIFSRVYFTDLNTAWQSCLEALKSSALDISNRESGFIQTKWTDNTEQKNFIDDFGGTDMVQKAQYRFRVNVGKMFYHGQPAVKVTVQKEQLIMRDVLEGWVPQTTDSIEENTLLYRIGRIIYMKMKLQKIEEQKENEELQNTKF